MRTVHSPIQRSESLDISRLRRDVSPAFDSFLYLGTYCRHLNYKNCYRGPVTIYVA